MYFHEGLVTSVGLSGLRESSGAGAVRALAVLLSGVSASVMESLSALAGFWAMGNLLSSG